MLATGRRLIESEGADGLDPDRIFTEARVFDSFGYHFGSARGFLEALLVDAMGAHDDGDPAQAVALACERVVQLANDAPWLVQIMIEDGESKLLFYNAFDSWLTPEIDRGRKIRRFRRFIRRKKWLPAIADRAIDVVRGVVDRNGSKAEEAFGQYALALLGLGEHEAQTVAHAAAAQVPRS